MKNVPLILTISICICSCQSNVGLTDIPEVVQASFNKQYPNAGKPTWEKENDRYEASYKQNNQEVSVTYNMDGTVFQTETEIHPETLPQSVRDYVTTQLGNKKITGAAKIVTTTGITSYEAEIEKTDYLFDSNGQYVGVEEKEAGEKEDNN